MCTDRRDFLRLSVGLAGATFLSNESVHVRAAEVEVFSATQAPDPIRKLKKMTAGVLPISTDERKARIAKAQRLMAENKMDAIYLEPGASMYYFTGVHWGTSERMFALVIPRMATSPGFVPSLRKNALWN